MPLMNNFAQNKLDSGSYTYQIATIRIYHWTELGMTVNTINNLHWFFKKLLTASIENSYGSFFSIMDLLWFFVNLIKHLYDGATCQIIHNGKLTAALEMKIVVRQWCLLSQMIFLIVVDWVTREIVKEGKPGFQWTLTQFLEDIDSADDLCLISQTDEHIKTKTNELTLITTMTGLEVNVEKSKIMKLQTNQQIPITLGEHELEDVEYFTQA